MTKDKFLGVLDQLQMKNRFLLLAAMVLLALNINNTMALQRARTQQQTVIVPVGGGAGMTVGDGKASHEYMRQMARYITSQIGTYTAATARPQLQELLSLFAPEVVGKAQVEFERISVQVERFPSIASVMRWTGEEALKISPNFIQVHAIKDRLVSGTATESTQMTYCIEYRIDEARLWILGIREETAPATDVCFQQASEVSTAQSSEATTNGNS